MARLTHERNSGIKTGYWSPEKKEELVQRLAAYEDTGLDPEQIRELDKLYAELCKELAKYRWIPVTERLPEDEEDEEALVLIQVSGKPTNNITLEDALMMASYNVDDGWILEMYPEWEGARPVAWMPLPEPYGGERK